jgi:hypothetical protein
MRCACSRRGLITGAITTFVLGADISAAADGQPRMACNNKEDFNNYRPTRTSRSDNPKFDLALIEELKLILKIIPVNPGFQYVKAKNAAATDDSVILGTKGTVWIGLDFVKELILPNDGGVSVAGVLAHECAHIFQFFSTHYDRLMGPTQRLLELHADLLAGYYMATKIGTSNQRLRVLHEALLHLGDFNKQDPRDHGTPGQRLAALDKGYELSLSGKTFEIAAREGEGYVRCL